MELSDAATAFGALSQETRLDLMRLLVAEGANGLPAGELGTRLGVPPSTLSFHLAALERAGTGGASVTGDARRCSATAGLGAGVERPQCDPARVARRERATVGVSAGRAFGAASQSEGNLGGAGRPQVRAVARALRSGW